MLVFMILTAIAVVGALVARVGLNRDNGFFWAAGMMVGVGGVLVLALSGSLACGQKIYMGQTLADIEALKDAAARVDIQQSEDIYGKVADFNRELARYQWANQRWWEDPFIPDEWDTVTAIPLERQAP